MLTVVIFLHVIYTIISNFTMLPLKAPEHYWVPLITIYSLIVSSLLDPASL